MNAEPISPRSQLSLLPCGSMDKHSEKQYGIANIIMPIKVTKNPKKEEMERYKFAKPSILTKQ